MGVSFVFRVVRRGKGEVVVVFDGLEGCGFAEKAEVVDCDGEGEDGLDCWM